MEKIKFKLSLVEHPEVYSHHVETITLTRQKGKQWVPEYKIINKLVDKSVFFIVGLYI